MSFNYHQLEDDTIEHIGSVQEPDARGDRAEEQTFCPQRPLLPRWPLCVGICEIIVGFICAGLGAGHVFIIPFLYNAKAVWFLSPFNSYGAALWSGFTLVVSGSLAVRVSKFHTLRNVQYFYMMTAFSFLANLAMMILILWSCLTMAFRSTAVAKQMCEFLSIDVDCNSVEEVMDHILKTHNYMAVALSSYLFCLLGCLLLAVTTICYFMDVMFGEVHLVKSILVCFLPCIVPYCKLFKEDDFYDTAERLTIDTDTHEHTYHGF